MLLYLSVIVVYSLELICGVISDTNMINKANRQESGVVSQENFISMLIEYVVRWSTFMLTDTVIMLIFGLLTNMQFLYVILSGVLVVVSYKLGGLVAQKYLKSAVEERYKSKLAEASKAKDDYEAGKINAAQYDQIIKNIK